MKGLLLSTTYQNRQIWLKFYHAESNRIIIVKDTHKPYCFVTPDTAEKIDEFPGLEITDSVKYDIVKDHQVSLKKVSANNTSLLYSKDDKNALSNMYQTWESDMRVYESYLYDKGLIVGKWYDIHTLKPVDYLSNIKGLKVNTEGIIDREKFERYVGKWASLLDEPIPKIRRLAFDIEVETAGSMPDPSTAEERVTAISFHSDDLRQVFVLKRKDVPYHPENKCEMGGCVTPGIIEAPEIPDCVKNNYKVVFLDSEKEMLEKAFEIIESYPVVLTYNGDMFDMPYLYNRAVNLGIQHIPFRMLAKNATLNMGVHIDMYGVFKNRSLKIYAFKSKYVEDGLDSVSRAMLGEGKIEYDGELEEIPLYLLAKYCYNDSRLTYKLSSFNNDLVMNLLIILCRISNLPIDDVSRVAISNWIKSLLYFTHRQNGELIPRADDFPKVDASTESSTDKKYEGAIVLEPQPGIHFGVKVLDFASLYPSIIKTKNISYETVCCTHAELWNSLDNEIKWLLYIYLIFINKQQYSNLCLNKERENLLKSIEEEVGNMPERIEEKILKNQENQQCEPTIMQCKIQLNEKYINEQGKQIGKNGRKEILNMSESTEENILKPQNSKNGLKNIIQNGLENIKQKKENNSIIQETIDVKNVETLIKEHLKSITLKGEIILKEVTNGYMMTGTNYNSFVQIVTQLLHSRECKLNIVPQTKHWACTKKTGIVSMLIGTLKELRVGHFKQLSKTSMDALKKQQYETISEALKVFLNASYGVIGFSSFPLYFLPTAEAVTAYGRDIISNTVKTARELGINVIYGDTDSIFTKTPTDAQIHSLIEHTTKTYNIDLEQDKEYRYVVLSSRRKNYFGIKTDGTADIKGLSGKKSNTPPFIRELFTGIMGKLKEINTMDDFRETRLWINRRIKDTVSGFDVLPLEQLSFKVLLTREPSEYKVKPPALKAAEQLEGKPQKGQFIQYVKIWKEPGVRPISMIERKDIDKPKYMESLQTILEQIAEPMQIDINSIITGSRSTKMEEWF